MKVKPRVLISDIYLFIYIQQITQYMQFVLLMCRYKTFKVRQRSTVYKGYQWLQNIGIYVHCTQTYVFVYNYSTQKAR